MACSRSGATNPTSSSTDRSTQRASILIAGPNFGTGSSREHAVWAIQQYGFAAVVSPASATSSPTTRPRTAWSRSRSSAELGRRLLDAVEADPTTVVVVDVERRLLEVPSLDISESFPLSDAVRHRFLEGLDDIGLTLAHDDEITAYEADRPKWLASTN
ncbi:MAG: 3-isopropylmalate dehydratase small subunit [Microthrixaceae bacterium]